MRVATVPSIEQQPRTVADTATHYGYIAFNDIYVGDRKVQPGHSPYYQTIPARQLIPFTNLDAPEPNTEVASGTSHRRPEPGQNGADPATVLVQKPARQCARELEDSYAGWGFKILYPLTGFTTEDAFAVFQTIQPFTYKLAHLEQALAEAPLRIATITPYIVDYSGETETLSPLRGDLKEVAYKVLAIMQESVALAVNNAEEIKNNTIQKMEQFYATGSGKKTADPLDVKVFADLNVEIPTLLGKKVEKSDGIEKLAELLSNRQPTSDMDEIRALKAELQESVANAKKIEEQWNAKFREKFAKKPETV